MNEKNFDKWISNFKITINDYQYFADFKKVFNNINSLKNEIEILNTLIGKKDLENEFKKIIKNHPNCLKVIPLLLATRENKLEINNNQNIKVFHFHDSSNKLNEYVEFIKETGIYDLLKNGIIKNLYDYLVGIEVGLDSNARKNRTGFQMENIVENFIQSLNCKYHKQTRLNNICKNLKLPKSMELKKWDFVIESNNSFYLIETNFYSKNGSKLNEIARAYKMIEQELKSYPNLCFIWITDGMGWFKTKNVLEDAYYSIKHIYNLNDLENHMLNKIINN